MNVRVATVLYAIAVAAIPIGVASKFLLGITGAVWIDPTLLLALAALLALFPRWGDFLTGGLRLAVIGAAALFFLSLVCTLSGVLLRRLRRFTSRCANHFVCGSISAGSC